MQISLTGWSPSSDSAAHNTNATQHKKEIDVSRAGRLLLSRTDQLICLPKLFICSDSILPLSTFRFFLPQFIYGAVTIDKSDGRNREKKQPVVAHPSIRFRFIPPVLMMAVTDSLFLFPPSPTDTVPHHFQRQRHWQTISFYNHDGSLPLIWRFSSNSSSCWSCFSSNSAFFFAFFFIFFFLLFDMLVVLGDCSSFGAVLTTQMQKGKVGDKLQIKRRSKLVLLRHDNKPISNWATTKGIDDYGTSKGRENCK